MLAQIYVILSQFTGLTDRQTVFSWIYRGWHKAYMQSHGKMGKNLKKLKIP